MADIRFKRGKEAGGHRSVLFVKEFWMETGLVGLPFRRGDDGLTGSDFKESDIFCKAIAASICRISFCNCSSGDIPVTDSEGPPSDGGDVLEEEKEAFFVVDERVLICCSSCSFNPTGDSASGLREALDGGLDGVLDEVEAGHSVIEQVLSAAGLS
jgi:hypothetical protein